MLCSCLTVKFPSFRLDATLIYFRHLFTVKIECPLGDFFFYFFFSWAFTFQFLLLLKHLTAPINELVSHDFCYNQFVLELIDVKVWHFFFFCLHFSPSNSVWKTLPSNHRFIPGCSKVLVWICLQCSISRYQYGSDPPHSPLCKICIW